MPTEKVFSLSVSVEIFCLNPDLQVGHRLLKNGIFT